MRKIGVLLVVAILGLTLGCTKSKDMVLKENVNDFKDARLDIKKIDLENEKTKIDWKYYLGDDIYGIREYNEYEKEQYSDEFYTIDTSKKVKLLNENDAQVEKYHKEKRIEFVREGKSVVKVFYYDEIENKKKLLREFKKDKENSIINLNIVEGSDKYIYLEEIDYTEGSGNIIKNFEIINAENKKILSAKKEFKEKLKGDIISVLYNENFYITTTEGFLYEVKNIKDELHINEVINIGKAFGIEKRNKNFSRVYLEGEEIIIIIGNYEGDPVKNKNETIFPSIEFIYKYNLKSGRKIDVNNNVLKDGRSYIEGYKNGNVVFSKLSDDLEKIAIFIGKIDGDNFKILGKVETNENIKYIDDIVFNDKDNKILIQYAIDSENGGIVYRILEVDL